VDPDEEGATQHKYKFQAYRNTWEKAFIREAKKYGTWVEEESDEED